MDSTLDERDRVSSLLGNPYLRSAQIRLTTIARAPWFSYVTILLLQLKLVWGMWASRDLTFGDTAYYFRTGLTWYQHGQVGISWSPLYTSLFGLLLNISRDAFWVTTTHRIVLVFLVTALTLVLLRRLLPGPAAWVLTAWWVIQPIDFNTLYEVHLFAILPGVLAAIALTKTGPWGRGIGIAILLAAAVLVRNETVIPTVLLVVAAIAYEVRTGRGRSREDWRRIAIAYAIPVVASLALISFYWSRADDRSFLAYELDNKHRLNVCQIYAYGYQQRHTDFQGSPWVDCQRLMKRDFGVDEPSMVEAIRINPGAMAQHFLWNVRLIPDGIELLLFNACYGSVDPDYANAMMGSVPALILGIAVLALVAAGLVVMLRNRALWESLVEPRWWTWLLLSFISLEVVVVMITQRPRPSYMLTFGIVLRAFIGICAVAVAGRLRLQRTGRLWLFPIFIFAAILFVPSFYSTAANDRPVLRDYLRLAAFETDIGRQGTTFLSDSDPAELCNYIGENPCTPRYVRDFREGRTSFRDVVVASHANFIYADESMTSDPFIAPFLSHAANYGWRTLASETTAGGTWYVLESNADTSSRRASATGTSGGGSPAVAFGKNWYASETLVGREFRWGRNDAQLVVTASSGGPHVLKIDIAPGPGFERLPVHLTVQQISPSAKLPVAKAVLSAQSTIIVNVPKGAGTFVYVLHAQEPGGKMKPDDPRLLDFGSFGAGLQ